MSEREIRRSELPSITFGELMRDIGGAPLIEAAYLRNNIPVFLFGKTGVGKTAFARDLADRLGRKLLYVDAGLKTAVDVGGVPAVVNKEGRLLREGEDARDAMTLFTLPPDVGNYMSEGEPADTSDPQILVFLDELNIGSDDVVAVLLQLLQGGRIGRFFLPRDTYYVCAGNPTSWNKAARSLNGALVNRVALFDVRVSASEWCDNVAPRIGVHSHIRGFLRENPQFIETEVLPKDQPYPSPRAWDNASRAYSAVLAATGDVDTAASAVAPIVGKTLAIRLADFARAIRVPSPQEILEGTAECPSDQAARLEMADKIVAWIGEIATELGSEFEGRELPSLELIDRAWEPIGKVLAWLHAHATRHEVDKVAGHLDNFEGEEISTVPPQAIGVQGIPPVQIPIGRAFAASPVVQFFVERLHNAGDAAVDASSGGTIEDAWGELEKLREFAQNPIELK